MKLTKVLTVGGVPVKSLVQDTVQLDLYSPARAHFKFASEHEPSGLVELQLGYAVNEVVPYFLGVIESKHESNGHWFITCRELLGAFSSIQTPMAIRQATAEKVLKALEAYNLEFVYPNADYMQTVVPNFVHAGNGIAALKQIGKVFGIRDFVFTQRPDGKIYVGSWHDCGYAATPINNFTEHPIVVKGTNRGELIAIPTLRPGIKLNGRYIKEVTLQDSKMVIQWSSKLLDA